MNEIIEKKSAKEKNRSDTFCVAPWVQVATNSSGYFRVCCHSISGKNLIRDEGGQALRVDQHGIEEAWHAESYRSIRTQFLAGLRPEMCSRCFKEEDAGIKSARQKWNARWTSLHEQETLPPLDIRYVDLRLGNLCNLRCRMCNPYSSSQWVDEWNQVVGLAQLVPPQALTQEEHTRLKKLNWSENDKTWQHLEKIISTVEEVYLTGGEPFLSEQQVLLLRKMIEEGCSDRISIKYNTNLTVLPEKVVELWKFFRKVQVNVSVDGISRLNEYIRHPTKWSIFEKNFRRICDLRDSGMRLDIGVHTTVQTYNILRLDEIISYFYPIVGSQLYFNILNHPHCLNIRCLPAELKNLALERLSSLRDLDSVNTVIAYLDIEEVEQKIHFEEFIQYTKKLDEIRGQNLIDFCPEFAPYFSPVSNT